MSSSGTFKDFDELCDELVDIHKNVSVQNLSLQEEGSVITFVEKSESGSRVISMAKIRSVEFSALKLTADMLVKAIDEGELDRNSENLTQGFIKRLKAISKHVQDKTPHPEAFYVDIFTTAS